MSKAIFNPDTFSFDIVETLAENGKPVPILGVENLISPEDMTDNVVSVGEKIANIEKALRQRLDATSLYLAWVQLGYAFPNLVVGPPRPLVWALEILGKVERE